MKDGYQIVTPDMAREWLATQTINRKVNVDRLRRYTADMANGKWAVNGESIKFKNGVLVDGQHRLLAIIRANVPVKILVVNVEDATMIDRGQERSMWQSLRMMGIDPELEDRKYSETAKMHMEMIGVDTYTDTDIYDFVVRNRDLFITQRDILANNHKKGVRVPYRLAMLYALKCGESAERLKEFHKIFMTGFYSSPSDTAAIVYRNDFQNGNMPLEGGSGRKTALCMAERAIFDFCHGVNRKVSYKSTTEHIYLKQIDVKNF